MATSAVIQIPRGYAVGSHGEQIRPDDGYESKILNWRDSALQQGLAELRENPEYESVEDYISLILGDHWKGINLATYRSKFVDNRIAKARIESLSYLTDIKPTIDVVTHVDEYADTAKIIKDIIQHEWRSQRMDVALEEVVDHALFG